MSSVNGLSNTKPDRVPLRDVQNEQLNMQGTPTLMFKHASTHVKDSNMKHEVVLGENPSSLAITTEVYNIGQTMDTTDEHQDIILKSFACLEGEVVVEGESVLSDISVLIGRLGLVDNVPLQSDSDETNGIEDTEDNETSKEHVDHPYSCRSRSTGYSASSVLHQEEEVSTIELENVTFKSLMCFGGEVLVSDSSAISNESIIIKDLASGNNSQYETTPVSKVDTEVVSINTQPLGHSYCNWKSHESFIEDSCTISTVNDVSQSTVEHNVGTQCEHPDLSEGCYGVSNEQEEVTLKSLSCSGLEIEIADLSKVSEMSLLLYNLAEEQSLNCLNDVTENAGQSFASLTPGSKHIDHMYCHAKEMSLVLNVSSTENELFTKSECLSERSGNTVDATSPLGHITEEKFVSVTCHEIEKSKTHEESSQHLSALNRENKAESSDVAKLNNSDGKPKDESSVVTAKHVEELNQQLMPEMKEPISHSEETLCPQDAVLENVGRETNIPKVRTLTLKDEEIHPEIEVMRLCDASSQAISDHQDISSAIVLTRSCTPKTPTLSRSVLHDPTAENPMSHLWPELPESPMPPPLLNSTSLVNAFSYTPVPSDPPKKKDVKPSADHQNELNAPPVFGNGPLQEQLRQMAELLMVASGKMVVPAAAPENHQNVSVGTSPVSTRSVCVWSTPVQRMERSVNTSGTMEICKQADVSDASTSTDSLLWNLSPGNLEHLSRTELEQRLTSTLIMVEVLTQQLTSSRAHNPSKDASPSDLREKLIQTDHTELRQNGTYRDLYGTALERIQCLEYDQEILHSLYNSIQAMRVGLISFKSSTEDAILKMKQIGDTVNVDQETLSRQASQMKSLYGRYK
ncbi:sperm-associated antigen 5 isoform X1 [Danio aesculapii]|uniref:sperm-associated antigen 5 isoform X1 n=1 Tax=Danio aesculapii TaxID=1142201 RepID=UPI0024BF45CC|nr:sperm-associated antigen 5 isoform X1 [Danio aesculapii]